MAHFWQKLKKPILALAPLDDVTDNVFREIVATKLPKPDVFFTEFTNADGLMSEGREKTIQRLQYTENQRPIVAQIWGTNLENLEKSASLVSDLGFDGVDINMGCPEKTVMKKGAGAALCKTPELAKEIIAAVKKGAKELPVSVKTRIGFNKVITDEWIEFLLEQNLDALTVHGRTAAQMSKVPADWDEIGKAVSLKNKIAPETILLGNGDVLNHSQVLELTEKYGVDGVMIGRGIFHNPWIFSAEQRGHSKEDFIDVLNAHLDLYNEMGANKHFAVMKKFFKMYINNFPGASEMRAKLMECKNYQEVKHIIASL